MTARTVLAAILIFAGVNRSGAQTPLTRHYRDGEKLSYRMTGVNDGRRYEFVATGHVSKEAGHFVEEYVWSGSPADTAFRQRLSLDPAMPPSIPDLSRARPELIGPITDLLTFYADLWLAMRSGAMSRAGDHLRVEHGTPASWADGTYVILGEDSIDFDITMAEVDAALGTCTLLVRHVPPTRPQVKLPAEWMTKPVSDTPNNWVEIAKRGDKFVAAAGKETFDVKMVVSLADGKILSGSIHNPVAAVERECDEASLATCGESHPRAILREIEIALIP